ncbi:helix-turn-helix domain-containing protein [Alkalimonas sp. MEB108]|uniref:Helix-turn-helix domain-containing protein n=1 Tax=Alkalimonas cellulosilytica TaxID=3058395 RepID=A0ABU7J3M3_9GAMM|nr:helix-turn-helix domain-containing protein [Alkalimonas sp. MEB108]MEE2000885.1 helix-turn-helix domain-containing protein [Alkalimonas sp. MEB108]
MFETVATRDLTPKASDAARIKALREREHVSQAVFAAYLNTSPSTVKQWEQGGKKPRGTSLKLLNLVADKGLKVLA